MGACKQPVQRIRGPLLKPMWHHKNPERAAWIVLLTSFAIFCVLAVSVPWGIYNFIYHSSKPEYPSLKVIKGTVLVGPPGSSSPVGVTGSLGSVREGQVIKTDETSEAVLTFPAKPDGSGKVTVLLYNRGQLYISRARRPRFDASKDPMQFVIKLQEGKIRTTVERGGPRDMTVEVQIPHVAVSLDDGSYSISSGKNGASVLVRLGVARVSNGERTVTAVTDERVAISPDGASLSIKPAAQNLVQNGDFSKPLSVGWEVKKVFPKGEAPPEVSIVDVGRRRAVYFLRRGKDNIHTEISLIQVLNTDVQDYEDMRLRMDVMLKQQSLAGGGYQGTEYPVMVEILYKDVYGHDRAWYHGFYYRDPPKGWPTTNGEKILPFVWYPYESENLIEILSQANIRPAVLQSVRIYASGWNYQSLVSEVELVVR